MPTQTTVSSVIILLLFMIRDWKSVFDVFDCFITGICVCILLVAWPPTTALVITSYF